MKNKKTYITQPSKPYTYKNVYDEIPSTIEPVGKIKAEITGLGKLKNGLVPWWVLVASWVFIALPSFISILFFISEILQALQPTGIHTSSGDKVMTFITIVIVFTIIIIIPFSLLYIVIKGTIKKAKNDKTT